MAAEGTALLLLAAGRSARFGDGASKLDAVVDGLPLGLHIVRTLAPLPFLARIAVTGRAAIDYASHGFETVANPDPDRGLSGSIRLGVARAAEWGAKAVLIVLADMPCVTLAHVGALLAVDADVVASHDGTAAKPPALFRRIHFPHLLALDDRIGARSLIRDARHVAADPATLIDIDTPQDLAALRRAAAGTAPPSGGSVASLPLIGTRP